MIFFWPKVYGPLGKTPYIYPRYQVWGVTDLNFDLAYYHPPLLDVLEVRMNYEQQSTNVLI